MSVISAGPVQGINISKAIKTTIDGTVVEGRVTGSSFDITVTITKPYTNLERGWHIPYFALGHRTFDGEYGDMRALETLENLYYLGVYLQQHEDALRAILRPYQQRIADLQGVKDEVAELSVWGIKEEFFDANLPDVISLSLRESVWEILAGRKPLSTESS
jgi:hypothetical protein